jgi:hypothetical protein
MTETLDDRLEEAADNEDDATSDPPVAEADEEPGCTVEGGLARL